MINEFSSFTSDDWVELYAIENTDISNWILRDLANTPIATVSAGTSIGPSTSKYYVIDAGNRLNIGSDTVKILMPDDITIVNQISYGGNNQVCAPEKDTESVGRVDDGNTIERFAFTTKGISNVGSQLNSCPTPTPEPTSAPTSTPTATPNPTAAPTKTPTPIPTKSPTPKPTTTSSPTSTSEELVLGIQNTSTATLTPQEEAVGKKNFPIFPVILIVAGVTCIAGALFFFVKNNVKKGI